MNFRGFRLQLTILVFIIVLVVGLSFQYLQQRTYVLKPLLQEVECIPGVEEVSLVKKSLGNNNRIIVNLKLDPNVPFALSFGQVMEALQGAKGFYEVQLEDSPNLELWSLYQQIQIAIEEANVTGEFVMLEQRVARLAAEHNTLWELFVDRDRIFLRLTQAENMLQRVIHRGSDDGKISVQVKGENKNG